MKRLAPRHIGFALFALAVGLLCIRLGFWQLDRLAERRAFNLTAEERMSLPPLTSMDPSLPADSLAYRPAALQGQFDPEQGVLLRNRARAGAPGVHLVTPLRLSASELAILVDRGWIPLELAGPESQATFQVDGEVTIQGILLPSQAQPRWGLLGDATPVPGSRLEAWRLLSIPEIQNQVPYPVAEVYLAQAEPLPGSELPIPEVDILLDEGSHLSYAIQWFAFAAIAWIGAAAFLVRRARTG